ncbi:MAG: hypothetical protein LQ338_005150 [Usnochroma carphineum]|nr:MAG: hypothetical protein LQ338_005150 [Usnochroma carphineum]
MAFPPQGKPPSLLGYYRLLAPTAAVRVSPLCLGTMNFGEAWKGFMGECDKKTSFGILDAFYDAGGNFIDTANNYQGEQSEIWLGEWMAQRKNREELVLATKFTSVYPGPNVPVKIKANYSGNHTKSLRLSLEASLKKLRTSYIDLLYVHWWDFSTNIPELMQSLHHLVASGKVLYLGISDTPAWIVSKANEYARCHALTQFSVYQGHWSVAVRDFERDIIHMCEAEGMGIAPWGALGRSLFKKPEDLAKSDGRKMGAQPEWIKSIVTTIDKLAAKKKTEITSIALAYVMHKAPYVFPIIGGRSIKHLQSNIGALELELAPEEMDELDAAAPFDAGFPMGFLFEYGGQQKYSSKLGYQDLPLLKAAGALDAPIKVQPPKPHGN